jgi:hypothetical protein
VAEGGGGALREILAYFGFEVQTEELKEGENKLAEFGKKVKEIAEGVAAAFAVEKIIEFAETNVRAMTEIEHSAQRLGISAESVQQFQFAAKSMGMEAESLLNMMGRMQVTQQAAIQGTGQAATAFKQLGVSVKDASGHAKSADDLLLDLTDGFHKIQDPTKRAALATQIFGRSGRELLPFLVEGREGIDDLRAAFKEFGGGFSEESMRRGKAFEKMSARLGLAWKSLKSVIVEGLLPPLTWLFEKIAQGVNWFRKITEGTHFVEVALAMLGAAALAFAAPMLLAAAPVVLLVAALGALALLVEDIVALLTGKQSVIGDAIDAIFGKDAHTDAVKALKGYWVDISDAVKTAAHYIKEFFDTLEKVGGTVGDTVAKGVNKVRESFADTSKGAGGLTYQQSVAARQAKLILESQITGAPLTIPEIPKGMSQGELMQAAHEWMPAIQSGRFPQFAPQTFGPANAPGGAAGHTSVDVNIHPSPEFHATVRKTVDDHGKSRRRAAVNTLPRAPQE